MSEYKYTVVNNQYGEGTGQNVVRTKREEYEGNIIATSIGHAHDIACCMNWAEEIADASHEEALKIIKQIKEGSIK